MKAFQRAILALLLVVACLPVLADDCPAIQSFSANDAQTGEPVTFTWSYTGGAPQTQTLTGHDFDAPIVLGPDTRSYTYTPSKPGQKHAQLAAVTGCGTVSLTTKYKVKQCNVIAPAMTVDQTSVEPGAVIDASIELKPGHTARWEVVNGTASATAGSAIQVTAGSAGDVVINAWVSRGSSCSVLSTATVEVVDACPIVEPMVYHPDVAVADNWFSLFVESSVPGETYTFEARGAEILYSDPQSVGVIAPSSGSFSIDLIVTNGTCTRTFTYTFTVEACQAAAVVRPGQAAACGYATAIAEFSGVPPFQGQWSDGEYFFTWDSTIEHPISGGTHTIQWMFDQYCAGTVTGSVTAGSSLPVPSFTIDEVVDGGFWGIDTCPGTVRTATLNGEVPAGATLEWSIPGGTIISGQGTPVVQFAGGEIGPTRLTAVLRDAQGCESAPYVQPFGQTMAAPQPVLRVEPATIPAGGTAVVTVEFLSYFTGGYDLTSSLGDTFVHLGNNQFEYRSSNGGGAATITLRAQNVCGSGTATATLDIDGGNPLQATAKVRTIGSDCTDYAAFAEFTGVPPFTGTWSNGVEFTTDDPLFILRPPTGGTYTLVAFADANGPGTVTGSASFEYELLPQPMFSFDTGTTCPDSIVTATLTTPLPAGTTTEWTVWGGDIISGQGTASIQIRAGAEWSVDAMVRVSGPNACSPSSDPQFVAIQQMQIPLFTIYPLYVGTTTEFDVRLDPNTTSWQFENSFGDTMEIVGNPEPNVYTIRYTSTHGYGHSNVRIWGTGSCGLPFEWTQAVTILPPAPTVTLSAAPGETCGSILTATFTGVGPFGIEWWDGETGTTTETTATRFISGPATVWAAVTDSFNNRALSDLVFIDGTTCP